MQSITPNPVSLQTIVDEVGVVFPVLFVSCTFPQCYMQVGWNATRFFRCVIQEANATTPVLMIATTGADPSKDLEEFAARTVGKAAYSGNTRRHSSAPGCVRTCVRVLRLAAGVHGFSACGCGMRCTELAMGGGQQAEALRLLHAAATEGKWLCLKNLHLVIAWLPTLEKELGILKPVSHVDVYVQ